MVRPNKKEDYVYDFSSSSCSSSSDDDDDSDSDFMDTGPYKKRKKFVDSDSDECEPAPKKRKVMVRKKGTVPAGRKVSSTSQNVLTHTQRNDTKPLLVLREAFSKNPQCPEATDKRMDELREKTNMPSNVIQYWFRLERKKHGDQCSSSNSSKKSNEVATHGKTERTKRANEEKRAADGNSKKTIEAASSSPYYKKTPKQVIILLEAYEEESESPDKGSDRMNKLSSDTGLDPETIRLWFKSRRKCIRHVERMANEGRQLTRKCISKEWMKQKEILQAAYEKDDSYPVRSSDRLKELSTQTGLEADFIQNFFSYRRLRSGIVVNPSKTAEQKKILMEAFEQDSKLPKRLGDRLKDLSEATGLEPYSIRSWFRTQRTKRKHEGTLVETSVEVKKELNAKVKEEETDYGHTSSTRSRRTPQQKTPQQLFILRSSFEDDPTQPPKYSERLKTLTTATGLDSGVIQDWFRHTQRSIRVGPQKSVHKTPEQLELLYASFVTDSNPPKRGSAREKELSEATELDGEAIRRWFTKHWKLPQAKMEELYGKEAIAKVKEWENRKKILKAAYEKDSTTPKSGSDRLITLCASTGMSHDHVQEWFKNRTSCAILRAETQAKKSLVKKEVWEAKTEIGEKYTKFTRKNMKTPEQLEILNASLKKDHSFPVKGGVRLEKLCKATGLDPVNIQKWFCSQYEKERKQEAAKKKNKTNTQNAASDEKPKKETSVNKKEATSRSRRKN